MYCGSASHGLLSMSRIYFVDHKHGVLIIYIFAFHLVSCHLSFCAFVYLIALLHHRLQPKYVFTSFFSYLYSRRFLPVLQPKDQLISLLRVCTTSFYSSSGLPSALRTLLRVLSTLCVFSWRRPRVRQQPFSASRSGFSAFVYRPKKLALAIHGLEIIRTNEELTGLWGVLKVSLCPTLIFACTHICKIWQTAVVYRYT